MDTKGGFHVNNKGFSEWKQPGTAYSPRAAYRQKGIFVPDLKLEDWMNGYQRV